MEVGRALLSGLETWVCYLTPLSLSRKGEMIMIVRQRGHTH